MTSKTGLIVVGYFVAAWVVVYLNKFAWPWVYLGFPVFFIPLSVGVWFGARKYRRPYLKGWASFAGWLISIVIGGLVEVFANLVQALYPFYQNPGVLLIWGIFFFLIADILFMQNRMEKLFRLLLAENRFY